jgi:hypothetical protein
LTWLRINFPSWLILLLRTQSAQFLHKQSWIGPWSTNRLLLLILRKNRSSVWNLSSWATLIQLTNQVSYQIVVIFLSACFSLRLRITGLSTWNFLSLWRLLLNLLLLLHTLVCHKLLLDLVNLIQIWSSSDSRLSLLNHRLVSILWLSVVQFLHKLHLMDVAVDFRFTCASDLLLTTRLSRVLPISSFLLLLLHHLVLQKLFI